MPTHTLPAPLRELPGSEEPSLAFFADLTWSVQGGGDTRRILATRDGVTATLTTAPAAAAEQIVEQLRALSADSMRELAPLAHARRGQRTDLARVAGAVLAGGQLPEGYSTAAAWAGYPDPADPLGLRARAGVPAPFGGTDRLAALRDVLAGLDGPVRAAVTGTVVTLLGNHGPVLVHARIVWGSHAGYEEWGVELSWALAQLARFMSLPEDDLDDVVGPGDLHEWLVQERLLDAQVGPDDDYYIDVDADDYAAWSAATRAS